MLSLRYIALVAVATSPLCRADILLGRVADPQGVGVANADLDVFDSATGAELTLSGDFTSADGTFAFVVPAGTFDVVVHPPAPPTTTLVGLRIPDVLIAGTQNLGDLVLEDGVVVTGRVLRPGGTPAIGADLAGRNLVTREDVVLTVSKTSLTGNFTTTAPAGAFRLSIDPGIDLPLAAPQEFELALAGATNLGDITLPQGFYITVTARQSNGTPVVGADIDAVDTVTGSELLTSDDDTDAMGIASFIVPAGVFDLEVCAPTPTRLVPQIIQGVIVAGPTDAGVAVMPIGRHLSGTVRNSMGVPVPDIDIDLFLPGTDTKVLTCRDDTDASGHYLTTVPLGTFDVLFEDVRSSCPESILVSGVTISADRILDATMTRPSLGCRYCLPGLANSSGLAATMDAVGSASVAQNNVTLMARDLPRNTFGIFLTSMGRGYVVQPGTSSGILCLGGSPGRYSRQAQIQGSGSTGTIALQLNLPVTPTPTGFTAIASGETWHFQGWFRDNTSTGFSNFTTGLSIAFE